MSRFPRPDYRTLHPYDPGRAKVEVDLSDNTNLWGTHPSALEVIRQASDEALTRYPTVYGKALKEAVARRFNVPRDCITTGAGSDDLLDSVFRASAFPPGALTYPAPSFSMVETFGHMNGMEVRAVPWEHAEADSASLLRGAPDLIYLCRPNNPTGHVVDRAWVVELLARLEAGGPLVVMDEAYADFDADSFAGEAPSYKRFLVLRTLSKLYGLAGLRIGFGIGSPDVVREVEKSRGPYKVNRLAEAAAVAALDDAPEWVPGILAKAVRNRARLAKELDARGLHSLPSRANFLLLPLPEGDVEKLNRALRERGVAGRPFPDLPGIGDALRVTVGPWALMERFLQALDEVLEQEDWTKEAS